MDAIVVTASHRYEVDFDMVARRQVFVWGPVSDDSDGRMLAPPYAVSVDEPLLDASIRETGYALAGDPDVALVDHSIAHPLQLGLMVDGYRAVAQTITVPANPVLPLAVPVALRRLPLRLTGRVTAVATGDAVASAEIALTGPPLPNPARALLLSRPLAADLSPTAQLQGHAVVPVASPVPVKTARSASAGVRDILLDDLQGLVAGQLLRFGPPDRAHWAEIGTLPGAPGLVRLTEPLALSVRESDPAGPFTLGVAVGPAATLIGAAFAGEGIIITDATPSGDIVVITDPPAPAHYHGLGVVSGLAGDYAIAGVARLARISLAITATGFTGQTRIVPLPGIGNTLTLDWRLQP
jgi:hypothetical protein